jgi:two-component system, cell cycle response regulator
MTPAAARSARRRSTTPAAVVLVGALALAGVVFFALHVQFGLGGAGADDLVNRWLYNAIIVLAATVCALRVAWVGAGRGPWLAITIGVVFWASGEVAYDFVYGGSPPYPSLADALYLAFYPPIYVGLVLLVRSELSRFNFSVWLDGITAALAAAALGAAVLFEVVLDATSGSPAVVVTNLAYPLGDVLLLAVVVAVFALTGWRPGRAWAVIGGGLAVSALADGIFLLQTATDTYAEGTILDMLWPASMLLIAAAAWQPGTRRKRVDLEGRPLLATPAVCGVLALVILLADHFHRLNALALGLASATLLAVLIRTGLTFRENTRILERNRREAVTDALTGLGNRRKLVADLEHALSAGAEHESALVIFDLDGFKRYNDTFGHPAGDMLLERLGANLKRLAAPHGASYRLGGDEFCVLGHPPGSDAEAFGGMLAEGLSERGEGFAISSSFGAVLVPAEAGEASDALRIADQRLYAHKNSRRGDRSRLREILLQALYERERGIHRHASDVATLSVAVAGEIGIGGEDLDDLRFAAELHDIGKLAVPDAVLDKPSPLDENEWALLRQHTLVGQRILGANNALNRIGAIVRHTHERWDGNGYADGLTGEEIPLAARVIAVCDAFSAMTSDRPYRKALGSGEALNELRRCAGTQFDPEIVEAFCRAFTAGELAGGDAERKIA